jgi:hypothetical protein
MLWLYLTIWVALLLFVAGETGRSALWSGAAQGWAWCAFTLGLVLALVHTALAFHLVHNWVHADAVLATARQTEAVMGSAVGWGVYVNYFFYAVWMADAAWWRRSPDLWQRPASVTWALRAFYLVIILNAAVIFAAGPRRVLGAVIVSWLVSVWAFNFRGTPASPSRR